MSEIGRVIIAIDPSMFAVLVFMALIFMVINSATEHPTWFDRATLIVVFSLTLFFIMLKVALWIK